MTQVLIFIILVAAISIGALVSITTILKIHWSSDLDQPRAFRSTSGKHLTSPRVVGLGPTDGNYSLIASVRSARRTVKNQAAPSLPS
jgi:hypothetical protein